MLLLQHNNFALSYLLYRNRRTQLNKINLRIAGANGDDRK